MSHIYTLLHAEFEPDGVGYRVSVVVHLGFGFSFYHYSGKGFRAAVADNYAAGVL
jgi:hypothetical protein